MIKKEFKNKEVIEIKAEFELHMVLEIKWINGKFDPGALITRMD